MPPVLVANVSIVLGGGLAGAADDIVGIKQTPVQWADATSEGGETSGDDSSDGHGSENVDLVALQGSIVHSGGAGSPSGQSWHMSGDESSKQANCKDSKDKGKKGQARWADDVGGVVSETSVNASAMSEAFKVPGEVKGERLHVRWADEVDGASSEASADVSAASAEALVTVRGLLKQALGRGKARQWLCNEGLEWLECQGCLTAPKIRKIASVFSEIRKEEGKDELKVSCEVSSIYQLLNEEMLRRSTDNSAEAAAGSISSVWWTAQKAKEPEPEGRSSLRAAAATALEWLEWYAWSLFRSA